jgi:hypothetical protein
VSKEAAARQRKSLCKLGQTVLQPCHSAVALHHVVKRNPGGFFQLKKQPSGEGQLDTLDL